MIWIVGTFCWWLLGCALLTRYISADADVTGSTLFCVAFIAWAWPAVLLVMWIISIEDRVFIRKRGNR